MLVRRIEILAQAKLRFLGGLRNICCTGLPVRDLLTASGPPLP